MVFLMSKHKKYDCDNDCYWNTGCCPNIDYCPETRNKEFIATIFAVLVILSTRIFLIVGIILFLLK